ncbi:aminoglycoside phosphotransferase family protein [Fodinicola feengrottensis]|uniref:aminoglycoside phosphotransferase family protein n=1 Tax=Fodinicola feengrottensis TaxID=435914 RepID=UPI0024429FFD|nr:aminoglycoside phosphotransferase family protein [Fodinicola feengrottensis]
MGEVAQLDESLLTPVLRQACELAGVPSTVDSPAVLWLSENAVVALTDVPVVAKIGREPAVAARAQLSLKVAGWLAEQGLPAVRPAAGIAPEVVVVDGHPVSFWEPLPEPVRPARAFDLGLLLRMLHALPAPPFQLPRRDLLANVPRWLAAGGAGISAADAAFLRSRAEELTAAVACLTAQLEPGVIHGDALPRNVRVTERGPMLLDLETFADDFREHDLTVLALARRRYGLDRTTTPPSPVRTAGT